MKSKIQNYKRPLILTMVLTALALTVPVKSARAMSLFFRPAAPILVPTTNYVVQVVTNATTGTTSSVTNQVVVPQSVPQFTLAPSVTTALDTGKTVSGFLPPPWDAAVSIGLTGIGSVLALVLKKKNGQLSTTQTILQSVITGVEAVGDANTKLSIQSHANAAGVEPDLYPIVQSATANAPGPIAAPTTATAKAA